MYIYIFCCLASWTGRGSIPSYSTAVIKCSKKVKIEKKKKTRKEQKKNVNRSQSQEHISVKVKKKAEERSKDCYNNYVNIFVSWHKVDLKAFAPPDQKKVRSDNEERKKKESESSASTKVNFG